MLRGMAVTTDAAPVPALTVCANAQDFSVHQAAKVGGHLGHHARVVTGAGLDLFDGFRVGQAVRGEKPGGAVSAKARGALRAQACRVVIGGADPQTADMGGRGPALAKPVGQPDMVRMHVGRDDAQDRQAFQLGGKDGFPLRLGLLLADAAVHHRPALDFSARSIRLVHLVAQQPQVDMVQCKRQRHAYPLDARRQLQAGAGLGKGVTQGVVELLFKVVHVIFTVYVTFT